MAAVAQVRQQANGELANLRVQFAQSVKDRDASNLKVSLRATFALEEIDRN